MKLKEWQANNNVVVGRHAHARTVNTTAPNQPDLFHLEDYIVSSVSAGTIWLIRRNGFSESEKTQRTNIRNACVGVPIRQLESLSEDETNIFRMDCIDEFIMELEAEERCS